MSIFLFRLWYSARYLLLAALIMLALLIGSSQALVLPWLQAHPDVVATWLSQRSGQSIRFERLQAEWTRYGPRLYLYQLHIGKRDPLVIDQACLQLLPYSGWLPGRPFSQLQLRGLSLNVRQDKQGQWIINGRKQTSAITDEAGDPLAALRRLGELHIADLNLRIDAPALKLRVDAPKINVRLRVNGQRLQAGLQVWMNPQTQPLTAALVLQAPTWDGLAFIRLEPVDWATWSPLLSSADIAIQHGQGTLQAWMQIQQQQLISAIALAELTDVALQGAAFAADTLPPPRVRFEHIQLRARWQHHGANWTLSAPQLRIALVGDLLRELDGLHLSGGAAYVLRGQQIDATPLLRLATLSKYVDEGLRQWLYQAQPQLRFNDVDIVAQPGQRTWVHGELAEVAFIPVGDAPGVSGLRGLFAGDQYGLALNLQASDIVRFDWPSGFGVLHEVQLNGPIAIWREGKGTHIATPLLRVTGSDYAADLRGGLYFQGDGTRPWIAMAASLDNAPMTAAKRFWVRSQMSQAAIDWLDAALVEGQVHGGLGLAVGDLDDWPFENNNGRFEARGHIVGGKIHFSDGWPLLREVQADIGFVGNGFAIQGSGVLADVPIAEFSGEIADFSLPWLSVTARSHSQSADLLNLLRQSPLQIEHAQTLEAVSINGPATVTFDLLQALDDDLEGDGHLQGTIALQSVSLADSRVELPLEQVNGAVSYSDNGFSAPALRVKHPNGAGLLALRSGEFVKQPNNVFEASLSTHAKASDLLDRVADLQWLKPWIHGHSRWHIAFHQPQSTDENISPAPRLHLSTDLYGTQLQLPAPLNKAADQRWSLRIHSTLAEDSTDINLTLGEKLAFIAHVQNEISGVYIHLGKPHALPMPLPTQGLVIDGHTDQLDAAGWIALSGYRQSESATNRLTLRRADIQADELWLGGSYFPHTRVQLQPQTHAFKMQFSGTALAGQLYIPDNGPISGQFSRVYWRTINNEHNETMAMSTETHSAAQAFNPSDLPALALVADELRFDDISLGQAILHTQPLPDGIQVNTFQLNAPNQRFDLQGQWRGSGATAYTDLNATLYSDDLGQWLTQLHYGGQLRSGQGEIQLTAGWKGPPGAFELAVLQGSLDFDIRNGQLLEVEPGAGRMLGLLSISQLPRRLRLDFRDFFARGLAFNQLKGTIQFDNAVARSQDIQIHSPAVDIRLFGQADLRQRLFDQTIEVNPRSGNLFAAVGALTGGPAGAAVGAATNALFSKPLGSINAKTWHLTGPWNDPHIKEIKRGTVE